MKSTVADNKSFMGWSIKSGSHNSNPLSALRSGSSHLPLNGLRLKIQVHSSMLPCMLVAEWPFL